MPVSVRRMPQAGGFRISLALTLVAIFFLLMMAASYWNLHMVRDSSHLVAQTHQAIIKLQDILSMIKDAETGQRGYLITGDDRYLEPYRKALADIDDNIENAAQLLTTPEEKTNIDLIKKHVRAKFQELAETINLRRAQGFEAARAVVITDRGKTEMDSIRAEIDSIQQAVFEERARRLTEVDKAYATATVSDFLTGLLGLAFSIVIAALVYRDTERRRREQWLQAGQVGLNAVMLGEQRVEQLGDNILSYLCAYLGAQAGVYYTKDEDAYRKIASYGVPADSLLPHRIAPGDGLLGQAAKERKIFMVQDVPNDYLTTGSALGRTRPRYLMIFPAITDTMVKAIIELGFLQKPGADSQALLQEVSDSIGVAVRSANYRANLHGLLEETQRQSEELQTQSEELRVNNEELEEQGRALKASQSNLEQQQAELEQTNSQLEEQASMLERQRDDIERANASMRLKAEELARASQYKSDFLANMSHELRTPLNSSLILAKLLGDNPKKNLTEEQVKYARTIESSGNDLLFLINDILDLSKIEAGHMEIRPATVYLKQLGQNLSDVFAPVARQKGLHFKVHISSGLPETIETDQQRLEQILKNLVSNAIKFTEQGGIDIALTQGQDRHISFSVKDSGIGIASDQQQSIFNAFQQADGTISRKYGGTGLGLSISRELARLLGGKIDLASEAGKGSIFTLVLPERFDSADAAARPAALVAPAKLNDALENQRQDKTDAYPPPAADVRAIDDRNNLKPEVKTILIVEDDASFAHILRNIVHELGFQCLIAHCAEEALRVATHFLPSAIILDIGLPDQSGLSVLDYLKRNSRTRHIPAHVVSAGDYAQTALSLGAVGYMLKPVKREQLIDVLNKVQLRLTQKMKHVLIIEDDAVQRESMARLLTAGDVQTIGVGSIAESLQQLEQRKFDCVVMDLSLPDASGYSLLEKLSANEAYAALPVIVYTGRDLSLEEEQRLRLYSKSIIIKGAKSPERLLDEVTLFLHQLVADLPPDQQRMLENARNRDTAFEGRRIMIVEDDVRNVYALSSIFEPLGASVKIARNGLEALKALQQKEERQIDLILMDVMMPEMDGLTATREIRKNPEWKKLPIVMLTAKAMRDDQEKCLEAGANDYMTKPLDVEKLLSLVRVWLPR